MLPMHSAVRFWLLPDWFGPEAVVLFFVILVLLVIFVTLMWLIFYRH